MKTIRVGDVVLERSMLRGLIRHKLARIACLPVRGRWNKPLVWWHTPTGRNIITAAIYSEPGFMLMSLWLGRRFFSIPLASHTGAGKWSW